MAAFSLHLYGLVFSFTSLVKDRALLAAEVMREYDEKVSLQCSGASSAAILTPRLTFPHYVVRLATGDARSARCLCHDISSGDDLPIRLDGSFVLDYRSTASSSSFEAYQPEQRRCDEYGQSSSPSGQSRWAKESTPGRI